MSLNLAHFLEMSAGTCPNHVAVMLDQHRMTYAEVNGYAKRMADVLARLGVGKGDKVAMMIPNTPFFPVIYYGILNAGATVVPINVLLKAPEIQYCLEDSEAKVFLAWRPFYDDACRAFEGTETCRHLVIASAPDDHTPVPVGELLMPLLREASPDTALVDTMPDDTAVLIYTSGTTGHPKGAELTHFNIFFNAYYAWHSVLRLQPDDVALGVLPLFHSFGQTCVMNATLMAGSTMSLVPSFSAERVRDVIRRDAVTVVAMVPSMYYFILDSAGTTLEDLASIRIAISGGSALPVEVLYGFRDRFGIGILEGYGLSETSPVASFNMIGRENKPGSIGTPIWGCEMRVMRDDGTFAATGEVGEIVIRGHNVMKGYYKKPAATDEAIVNGWFHTGDLARTDEDGYFFIVDRKKDIVIRSGLNIYPREIEEVLYGHPAILEAAVIGVPDKARGEEVKAYVALRDGAKVAADELRTYCKERMARYKVPREFEIVPSLPKGPTGKVLKRVLRGSGLERA